jgi:GGDEF domain-containing protein
MADLDLGRQAGDAVLKELAARLTREFGKAELAAAPVAVKA